MSMKQPKFWIIGLLGITLLGGTIAALHNQRSGPGRGAFRWGGLPPDRALQRLGLTDEQKAEVEKLRESHKATISALRKQGAGIRTQLREQMGKEESSSAKVGELVIEGRKVRQQIRQARQSMRESFAALLTAEQKEKVQKGRGRGARRGSALPPKRALKRLGLTEEQMAEVKKLRENHRATMASLREKGAGVRSQLQEQLEMEESSPAQVGELVINGRDVRQQMRKARESVRESFSAVLTEEQKEKIEKFRDRRGRWGGPRRHGPRGRQHGHERRPSTLRHGAGRLGDPGADPGVRARGARAVGGRVLQNGYRISRNSQGERLTASGLRF